jgi:hypothetical protein
VSGDVIRFIVGAMIGLPFAASVAAQEVPPSALVVTAGKSWSAEGKPLARGRTLSPDAQVNQAGSERTALVLDCGKSGWLSYTCDKLPCTVQACRPTPDGVKAIRVDFATGAEAAHEAPASHGWFASLFTREPTALAVLGVRGETHVTESVLELNGSQVYLGPALNRVLEGTYCFRFTPLPSPNTSAARQAALNWDRSVDNKGAVNVAGIQPGLYATEKSDNDAAGACQFASEAVPTWVLLANSSDFPNLAAQWKTVRTQLSAMENEGVSPTVLLTVRHAALAHLADSISRSK